MRFGKFRLQPVTTDPELGKLATPLCPRRGCVCEAQSFNCPPATMTSHFLKPHIQVRGALLGATVGMGFGRVSASPHLTSPNLPQCA